MIFSVKQILETAEKQREEILNTGNFFYEIHRECHEKILPPIPQFARIIIGIRRCGKSTFVCQDLKERCENTFYLNFDDPSLVGFDDSAFAILDEAISEFRKKYGNSNELFFDEIQSVQGWEVYVSAKLKEGNLVTVTGSNASLLSQELGTRLTGRHLDYEVFPFSFNEFCTFLKKEGTVEDFSEYIEKGGFPEYLQYRQTQILTRLFDDILFRDIIVRYGIKDSRSLRILAVYLCSNCGNLVTGSKLSAQLGLKTTATILEYLSYLEQSYLFSLVPKFDYSPKAQSVNPKKVYCIDTGLAKSISISAGKDLGRLFENAVFSKIRRETKNIWYYSEAGFECDFLYGSSVVPEKAVQVCYELTNENLERESKGLVETMKKFPDLEGKIVTLKQNDKISYDGKIIEVVDAMRFFG
ncbi:MAG: ATP-binding protein [Treponema sp.]|nr:ATP-binding protein [Candidatus Treponema equifaecale]